MPGADPFPEFAIACGEEASDPLVLHDGQVVRVDELAASGHLARQEDDLADVAGLGVRVWRYGMPWRLVEREPGTYDWSLWDGALSACDRHGLVPVVDLCHFGLPDHEPGFCEPGWVDGFGAEGFGCHVAVTPEDEPAASAARELEQLVWDLHLGVEPPASVADVFDIVDDRVLARITALAGPTDSVVVGHDVYPVSVRVHGRRDEPLSIDERVDAYDGEARAWYERYQRPFWVAETSNLGLAVDDGPRWLDRLVACLDRLRADGLPARGLCWYSRGDQYDWHTMLTNPVGEVTVVGLFDAARSPRPVAAAFASLARTRRGAPAGTSGV